MKGVYDEGTRDYSHAVVLPLCISLWQRHKIMLLQSAKENAARCHETLRRAWGTESVVPPAFTQGAMACVFLPTEELIKFASKGLDRAKQLKYLKKWVHDELLESHDVEVPVFIWRGRLAVRVSAPIYIKEEHIEGLATAVT